MVTLKEAFQNAVEYGRQVIGDFQFTLEEVERDTYKDKDVWCITLGFPKRSHLLRNTMEELLGTLPREYKTFLIDAQTGEALAMKIREVAT